MLRNTLRKSIKIQILGEFIFFLIIAAIAVSITLINNKEISNAVTSFLVIDISNTERKNLRLRDKVRFYDSISTISRAVVCGFIAPLFYIALFGNAFGIFYMVVYNLNMLYEKNFIIELVFNVLSIIPCLIAELYLYLIYAFKNSSFFIDFKGDFISNCFMRPLLNIDIFGAYIESVNFYYCYNSGETDYMKSYGGYHKKIDSTCIKDYLGISYTICILCFLIFFIFVR